MNMEIQIGKSSERCVCQFPVLSGAENKRLKFYTHGAFNLDRWVREPGPWASQSLRKFLVLSVLEPHPSLNVSFNLTSIPSLHPGRMGHEYQVGLLISRITWYERFLSLLWEVNILGVSKAKISFLTLLEATCPTSKCQQGRASSEDCKGSFSFPFPAAGGSRYFLACSYSSQFLFLPLYLLFCVLWGHWL